MTIAFELTAIDRHFTDFICRESAAPAEYLRLAASLASNAAGNGHICLHLSSISGREIRVDGRSVIVPELERLSSDLHGSSAVGRPGEFRPLILDGAGRLYLHRYWKYEHDLASVIREKGTEACVVLDEPLLGEALGRLFSGGDGGGEPDWQKVAALAAVRKHFCIISGGPGTGKTSTVVKILALLIEQAGDRPVRIALAAPTGKSAARLKESITLMKENLACADAVKQLIPHTVTTIHRLLGPMAGSVRFRHSDKNRLPYDTVIIDEASMVALPLMAKLATALASNSRLILLGDRDQLASVEAGAVLGDLCGGERPEQFSQELNDLFGRLTGISLPGFQPEVPVTPLTDALVVLKKNYRFPAESGIAAVSRAVNSGNGADALVLLKAAANSDIVWRAAPKPENLKKAISAAVVEGYRGYLAAENAAEALERFDAFRVLCAVRQGMYGVIALNGVIEEILAEKGMIAPDSRWYKGRPVLVTVNDYNLKLFNGDVGILFPDPAADGALRVFFPAPEGGVRSVSPVRLPTHETVYAMTIHTSQGSEFGSILMLLPDRDTEVLSRELIYTGITRAKQGVELWGDENLFVTAVARRIERASGLGEALWS